MNSRKSDRVSKTSIVPSGFFVLRSPLLPIDRFLEWSNGASIVGDDLTGIRTDEDWDNTCRSLRAGLRDAMRKPLIEAALLMASPDFVSRISDAADDDSDCRNRRRLDLALLRYFTRICSRPTPFGFFAGTSLGVVGRDTRLRLAKPERNRRRSELSFEFLERLTQELVAERLPDRGVKLTVNSSLTPLAGRFHYIKHLEAKAGGSLIPCAIEGNLILHDLIDFAAAGPDLAELIGHLRRLQPKLSKSHAHALVSELVEEQVLLPDMSVRVTCDEPIGELIDRLQALKREPRIMKALESSLAKLVGIDDSAVPSPEHYRQMQADLGADRPGRHRYTSLFRGSLTKPADELSLSTSILDEISLGVDWLHRWCGPSTGDPLAEFVSAYYERYRDDEVPLAEALDCEIGVGLKAFASETEPIGVLGINIRPKRNVAQRDLPKPRLDLLRRRLREALDEDADEIHMHDHDIGEPIDDMQLPPLPAGFVVKGNVASGDSKVQFVLHGVAGPTAATSMAAYCNDHPDLLQALKDHLANINANVGDDSVIAEIIYAPTARIATMQRRPCLSEYEIPYLGASSLPADRQIPVNDLLVSIRDGEIALRSRRLNKRVIPRLSTPHDYRNDPDPTYRFLGHLQHQNAIASLRWLWGSLQDLPFLPRVVYRSLALSPATWNLNSIECSELAQGTRAERWTRIRKWRAERRIPRYALLANGDPTLLIDFKNPLCVENFANSLTTGGPARLEEVYTSFAHHALSSPEGCFTHDLLIPFTTTSKSPVQQKRITKQPDNRRKARVPRSNWLYLKLYCGPVSADRLLRMLGPIIADKAASDSVGQWHFVRYSDTDPHIRLRFEGAPDYLHNELRRSLHQALEEPTGQRMIWRIEQDIYEPEVGRYGGRRSMNLVEQIFFADSACAIALLAACPDEDLRWLLALKGIDSLLCDFGLSFETRTSIVEKLRSSFSREFGQENTAARKELGQVFRKKRALIDAVLRGSANSLAPAESVLDTFKMRSCAVRPLAKELVDLLAQPDSVISAGDVAAALVHLHCNRILRWPSRPQEMVLYDFLNRTYRSSLARDSVFVPGRRK